MLREIDATHYCAADGYDEGMCITGSGICSFAQCNLCRSKWETPAQYKERTGEDWPDYGAVYVGYWYGSHIRWLSPNDYGDTKKCVEGCNHPTYVIICANTDWGKPDDDWRPE